MSPLPRNGVGGREQALANGQRLLSHNPAAAAQQAQEMLRIDPADAGAFRLLGAALRKLDRSAEAEQAELGAVRASAHNPLLVDAANAIAGGAYAVAERLLRPYLQQEPADAAAQVMLARIAAEAGAPAEAETLLHRALEQAPAYVEARLAIARLQADQGRLQDAIHDLDLVLARHSDDVRALTLKAALLGRLGEYAAAIALHDELVRRNPGAPKPWIAYGHALRTIGRRDDAVKAYRHALSIDQASGEAWWSIGNLKTGALADSDLSAMRRALTPERHRVDVFHLHFAIGKALEDRGRHGEAFAHYADANRSRREMSPYDPAFVSALVARSKAQFTPTDLDQRPARGSPTTDPIFIVGMPRSGSTLLEQILSSHSAIEGTSELPYIPMLWREPADTAKLSAVQARSIGGEYLRLAAAHRKTDRPFFIDKLPNNWANIGFIHTILPNARIVDVRRHPLGCGFANFKQHFGQGQAFAYDLADIGRYYRDYVELLAHFDRVLPGRIHRVFYEKLIADPETEIRKLLDHLDLPFEPGCLLFHQNERPVRTPSSEQVRQPINRAGLESWQPYRQWLGPLEIALGPVLDLYPETPAYGE